MSSTSAAESEHPRKNPLEMQTAQNPPRPMFEQRGNAIDPANNFVTIQMGVQKFVVPEAILGESDMLYDKVLETRAARLTRLKTPFSEPFYLDGDPGAFVHILNFLRYKRFPLFWDVKNGHDYAKYDAVEALATHFDIRKLADWLKQKKYEHVITIEVNEKKVHHSNSVGVMNEVISALWSNTTREYIPFSETQLNVYHCPLGKTHPGLDNCSKACFEFAKLKNIRCFRDVVKSGVLQVTRQTKFHNERLLAEPKVDNKSQPADDGQQPVDGRQAANQGHKGESDVGSGQGPVGQQAVHGNAGSTKSDLL